MFTEHPKWCSEREAVGEDHRSFARAASSRNDIVGLTVRLVSLSARTSVTVVEIEYVDDEVRITHQLPVRQAIQLAKAIVELTSGAEEDITRNAASLA